MVRRRPGRVEDRAGERGEADRLGLGSSRRQTPELCILHHRLLLAKVGEERNALAVRRPARRTDVVGGSCQPYRLATVDIRDPDARELVAVSPSVDLPGVVEDAPSDGIVIFADDESL